MTRLNHAEEIRAAQIGLLYEQAPSALIATGVNAAILTAVMWGQVPKILLLVWLLAILIVDLGRYALQRDYLQHPPAIAESLRWGRRFIYGVTANGVLWGFAGFFFFVTTSYEHQIFLVFVLGGMVSGAISTLSPVRGAYLAFLVPALVPYAARLLGMATELHLAMGAMLLLYVTMMWMISRRLYATVAESLRLRFDNLNLLQDLTQARERQEIANQELVAQIAEKRVAQQALQESYAELEQRVQERTQKLAHSEEALRDADKRKDEFLAMLGHELRNPLAPIRNAVHLMQRHGASDSAVKWAREVINRQIDHLTRLVDDLLDLSRIGQGKISVQETILDLSTVVDQVVEATQPQVEARHQELHVSFAARPLWVRGDRVRLSQVISNLLNNAVKFTDCGGRIQLHTESTADWLMLCVQDNGIGIPVNELPNVFDLFTQADHSLARTQGGLGIGLTLVKRVVEMHGGRVEARSSGPGQGSAFFVHLPLTAAPIESEENTRYVEAIKGSKAHQRVLVAEDNQDSVDSLAYVLRLEGYTVAVAFDGPTALAEAAKFQPHVVLLDIGLPGMNGYDVARELRTQEATKSVLILALTGYGQPEDRARSKAAGFTDHLTKPIEPALLIKTLKKRMNAMD